MMKIRLNVLLFIVLLYTCQRPPDIVEESSIFTIFNYSHEAIGLRVFPPFYFHDLNNFILLAGDKKDIFDNLGIYNPEAVYDSIVVYDTLFTQNKFKISLEETEWEKCGNWFKYFIHDFLNND